MDELQCNLNKALHDSAIKGSVIISGKPNCFIAGADISMLQACRTSEEVLKISQEGQKMLNQVETSSKPVVAAIMGACLGGGLEVCLTQIIQKYILCKNKFNLESYEKKNSSNSIFV